MQAVAVVGCEDDDEWRSMCRGRGRRRKVGGGGKWEEKEEGRGGGKGGERWVGGEEEKKRLFREDGGLFVYSADCRRNKTDGKRTTPALNCSPPSPLSFSLPHRYTRLSHGPAENNPRNMHTDRRVGREINTTCINGSRIDMFYKHMTGLTTGTGTDLDAGMLKIDCVAARTAGGASQ